MNSKSLDKIKENEEQDFPLFNPFKYRLTMISSEKTNDYVVDLKVLKNGQIAVLLRYNYLNLYKYNNKIELKLSIETKKRNISFCQLSNENIVICYDLLEMEIIKLIEKNKYKTILITKIRNNIFNYQKYPYFKVVEIKNNLFMTIFRNCCGKSFRLWKLNNGLNYEFVTEIRGNLMYNALKLNRKEFAVLEVRYYRIHEGFKKFLFSPILKFYNSNNYKLLKEIKLNDLEYKSHFPKRDYNSTYENICLINKDLLCVGFDCKGMNLIKISTHECIKYINYYEEPIKDIYIFNTSSIIKFSKNLFIVCGRFDLLIIYKYERDKENMKKKLLLKKGDFCCKLNDEIFIIYKDKSFSLWNLKYSKFRPLSMNIKKNTKV